MVEYDVPVSAGSTVKPKLALNWLWGSGDEEGIIEALSSASRATGDGPQAEEKLKNSIDFIKFTFRQGFLRPVDFVEPA